jgi:hypothetical protein
MKKTHIQHLYLYKKALVFLMILLWSANQYQVIAQNAITPKHTGTIASFSSLWSGSGISQLSISGNDYILMNANNASIQTPNLDFTGKRAIVYLQLKAELGITNPAMLSVEISTNGGVSWDNLDEIYAADENFSSMVINASAYNGSQNIIRIITYNNTVNNAIGIDDIVVIGYDEPTIQASNLQFTCLNNKSVRVDWAKGNGNRTAVFMLRSSSAGVPNIEDGLLYNVCTT